MNWAGGSLSTVIEDPDVEHVEAVGVQAGQFAVASVPTESQRLLLRVVGVTMAIMLGKAFFFPVINLLCVRVEAAFTKCHYSWQFILRGSGGHLDFLFI